MRITDVTQHHVEGSLDGAYSPTWIPGYPQATNEAELIEVETDEGITGWAASPSFAGGIEYGDQLSLFLTGQDPHDISGIRRKLETFDLIGPRPWHIEMAMWDIIGKDAGKPVYELLGGTDDPIPAYASTGEHKSVDERIEYVLDRVSEGFEATKLRFGREDIEDDLEVARAVRERFPDITLMVDANMGWKARVIEEGRTWNHEEAAYVAEELGEIGTDWLEEPLDRYDYRGYARLRKESPVRIAGGEFTDSVHELRELLRHGSLDVIQPDCAIACGLGQAKSIAEQAQRQGIEYTPHSWTNGLGVAANLHVAAATDPGWFEYPHEPPFTPEARDFVLETHIEHEDGKVTPPDGPGLGVEIDHGQL